MSLGKLLVIAVFGLVLFGPRRMIEIVTSLGRAARQLQQAAAGVGEELKAELDEAASGSEEEEAPGHPAPGPRLVPPLDNESSPGPRS